MKALGRRLDRLEARMRQRALERLGTVDDLRMLTQGERHELLQFMYEVAKRDAANMRKAMRLLRKEPQP